MIRFDIIDAMAAPTRTKFRLYAPGRRLHQHDLAERRQMTGSTGIAAATAASLLILFYFALRFWPAILPFDTDQLWTRALYQLVTLCLIPFIASAVMQLVKAPSARFVLGSGTKAGHVLLAASLGLASHLILWGASLLISRMTQSVVFASVPPLINQTIVTFQSSVIAHMLIVLLGVILTAVLTTLLTCGYIATCLDIGWHRVRAVLGTALFFALLFRQPSLLPAMFLLGILLAVIRLNTDSLVAAIACFAVYLLSGMFQTPLHDGLARFFFGQTRLDAGHAYSLALIILLSGAALFVPSFVFLSGMWRDQHTERLREALALSGDKPLPEEPDRPVDIPFILAVALLLATTII
ncbi:MAG TPA: hypothetical protein GXZ89_06375 [Fastidiosipila sp.]|nr:hypothetical protein [Fastidiosipila sp.]